MCRLAWFEAKTRCDVSADGRVRCDPPHVIDGGNHPEPGDRAQLSADVSRLMQTVHFNRSSPAFRTAADGRVELDIGWRVLCHTLIRVPVQRHGG